VGTHAVPEKDLLGEGGVVYEGIDGAVAVVEVGGEGVGGVFVGVGVGGVG